VANGTSFNTSSGCFVSMVTPVDDGVAVAGEDTAGVVGVNGIVGVGVVGDEAEGDDAAGGGVVEAFAGGDDLGASA
jgi:hypothetical protein